MTAVSSCFVLRRSNWVSTQHNTTQHNSTQPDTTWQTKTIVRSLCYIESSFDTMHSIKFPISETCPAWTLANSAELGSARRGLHSTTLIGFPSAEIVLPSKSARLPSRFDSVLEFSYSEESSGVIEQVVRR